jgi:hypothetical protein
MRRPILTTTGLIVAALVACSSSDHQGPGGGGSRVTLDAQAAVHDSVTAAGKVLTATSHGVSYTLTIPAGAVKVPTVITMTPVTAIDHSGLTQLVGAVDLQPQGLVLGKVATLRIAVGHSAPAGTALVGFGFEGDADSLSLLLPTDSAGAITVAIQHFSGGGAAFATLGQIQLFAPSRPLTGLRETYVDSMFELTLRDPREFLAEQELMRAWFTGVVLPAMQNAANDVALLFALSEYDLWRSTQTAGHLIPDDPLFAPERNLFAQAALPKLQQAIADNNAVCVAQKDISFANNVLYWQTVAAGLGIDSLSTGLDRATVLAQLCIQVLITDTTYPDPATPGQAATLDLLAGLKFGIDPLLFDQLFAWRLDIAGSTADGTVQGLSDPVGGFQRAITPSGQGSLVVAVSACLFAAEVPYSDVCGAVNVTRNFSCNVVRTGDITLQDTTDIRLAKDLKELHGQLTILTGSNTVIDLPCLVSVEGLDVSTGVGSLLHLPALSTVSAPAGGGALHISNTGLGLIDLPALQEVGEQVAIQNNAMLTDLALGAVHVGQTMAITGNSSLTALSLGSAHIGETLAISDNDALTSLDGVSLGIIVDQILAIEGNAGFTDDYARAFAASLASHPPTLFIDTNGP